MNLGFRHAEYRTHHSTSSAEPAYRRYAAHSPGAATAREAHQHGLKVIVGIVRRGEQADATRRHHALKKSVALAPCRLLKSLAALARRGGNVNAFGVYRHAALAAYFGAEFTVALRLRAAYHVVKVGAFNGKTGAQKHVKQRR